MERIKHVDNNAIVDWCCHEHSPVFKRDFVCPSTRVALLYTQPYICLDACHTKKRKYHVQLFLATALDRNSEVAILAYALAPIENIENWTWFVDLLYI